MNSIHANPVEIVKKDIYIIKNDINNKVYVGQAKNTKSRFIGHCKPSSIRDNSLIDKAIQKYGKEHFWYEILESQIENYNERERYWIKQCNSLKPNGYNILEGGEDPPVHRGIDSTTASITLQEVLDNLKKDLRETKLSYNELAKKYGTNKKTVLRINHGISYSSLEESYPIRKEANINGILTEEQVDEIIDILTYTYRQYGDIGTQYGVGIKAIQDINSGKYHHRDNIDYPIRTYKNSGVPAFTYEQVTEIIDLLKNSDMSMRQIGIKFGGKKKAGCIYQINNGSSKRYFRKTETYPIRKPN